MNMKKFLSFSLAALLAVGFMSCSKDADSWGGDTPLEKDQSFFANIAINGTETMSRAGVEGPYGEGKDDYNPGDEPNFDKGTTDDFIDENKVTTIYLVFYDADGNRVSTTQVRRNNLNKNDADRTASENSIYSGVVQIDVKHGSKKPAYVMAFINPITATNFEINPDFATLTAVDKTTRPRLIDDAGNFAMSKSVYYGKNPVTGAKNERITATPFLDGQLFESRELAEAALGNAKETNNPVVDIYVERYAAKVQFSVAVNAPAIKVDDNILTFYPEYWAVNAYEDKTYVTKSFYSDIDDAGEPQGLLSYDDLTEALGGANAWYWNSEPNHRCYWAQSPAYYSESYPRVADDIKDQMSFAAGGYSLGYYSYNEIRKNADKSRIAKARNLSDPTDKTHAIYARENTVAGKALKSAADDSFASPKAAVASVVLVGRYYLNDKEVADDDFFYVSGNATNGYMLFKNEEEMLNYFMLTTIRFSLDKYGYDTFFDYTKGEFPYQYRSYKDYFKIEHPSLTVRDDLVIDSRFVTIQLDPSKFSEDSNNFWALLDGEYVEVTSSNVNEINKQMLYAAGTVQGFQGGKAYFTIPIKHLGFYRQGNANAGKNATDKNFNWQEVLSGDFGLVRNHSYSIIVDNITGLGNAIPDPDDPLVPPTDPEEYFIGARIIVLNWAIVPTQHVTL